MVKAVAEVASKADKPRAAAMICTRVPAPIPSAAADPARQPCVALRVMIRMESGPGAILSKMPAMMNWMRSCVPNIDTPVWDGADKASIIIGN